MIVINVVKIITIITMFRSIFVRFFLMQIQYVLIKNSKYINSMFVFTFTN